MSELLTAIKSEITRLARKEVKKSIATLQATVARQRKDISALRAEVVELKKANRASTRGQRSIKPVELTGEEGGVKRRFSPERLAKLREKTGLSAAAFGKLVGVTGKTIYNWESGQFRPMDHQLEAIAKVRGMSKAALSELSTERV